MYLYRHHLRCADAGVETRRSDIPAPAEFFARRAMIGMAAQTWNADVYARNARFVSDLGQPTLELLNPQPGERILDLGCGDGALTAQLSKIATVVGVDASPEMIAAACMRGLDARVADAQQLDFNEEFDAVFTNAAMHWMPRTDDVLRGVARSLRPGGRFVGEFGGHGCVAAICTAIHAVLIRRGVDYSLPWYFPTTRDFRARLESQDFEVRYMELIPRPTPLTAGIEGWLETFSQPFLGGLEKTDRKAARGEIADLLRPSLCDSDGNWTADYMRIRFAAVKPAG